MTTNPRKRIGLLDDEEAVRFSMKALLSYHNYEVEVFDSAESLLAVDALNNFDCLIIDYRMRGLSGLQLLTEIKKQSEQPIPSLVVSGYTSAVEINELKAAGVAGILNKPVKSQELMEELKRITEAEAGE